VLSAVALAAVLPTGAVSHAHTLERVTRATGTLGQQMLAEPGKRAGATAWASASAANFGATPRAECGPGSRPEPGIQGRVPGGSSAAGFTCNTRLLGRQGRSGGYKVERFVDKSGRECAYYDNTLLFPTNVQHLSDQPTGVTVVDMSNPSRPRRTATLATPAMQSPHESLVLNERRGLLAAVMGNPTFYPGFVDIYDLNEDCRHPALQSSLPVGLLGHESGFAPDGRTFYATSLFTGQVTAVDVRNPRLPVPVWVGQYRSHGLTVSNDGNRAYLAALNGLIILDTSEIQARRPNPQVRELSRLTWSTQTIPQVAHPVTIGGRPYLVEIDEFATDGGGVIPASNGSRVGAARIIDISNERAPRVVSNIRLAVHQPQNRAKVEDDPGTSSPVQGYSGHYCSVPRRREPGIVACSFIASGLRVFDIRDARRPRELAYFVAPRGSSSTGGEPSNYAMSSPAFAPARGEIWYSDGNTGFHALRVSRGVWPFTGSRSRACLARRSPIGARNVGRVRLGYTRARMLRRAPRPVRRGRYAWSWCVKRGGGRVTAVFSRRSARGRVRLVVTTAPRHGMRGVRRGVSVRRLLRRLPRARRVSRRLYRASRRSRRVFGVRRGKVRFVGVADRRLLRSRRQLRRYLRRAGL
jgi:hypothetical protein